MDREQYEVVSSPLGRIAVSNAAIVQIVGHAAAESYGVVALAGRSRWSRLVPWGLRKGVDVERHEGGLAIELRIVVQHGLKLAEVATAVRSRVQYEVDRMVGIPIAALDVHIEGVRGG
ncbi:MAG: Asp23/Gls24 family envelope stress response protein [Gaiellaceae bacterium]